MLNYNLVFFYAAVDSKVADAVLSTRPRTLVDAVYVAIELEQGILYKTGSSSNKVPLVQTVDWSPMGSGGNDPMEIDVNAQFR